MPWADAQEGLGRLLQDLLAMGDEEHPMRTHLFRVEGCQPGLSQARRQHHEAASIRLFSGCPQRLQRLDLHRVGTGGSSVSSLPGEIARGGRCDAVRRRRSRRR